MEQQIETFKQIAAQQRELPVWEKFETHEEDHQKLKMEPPPKMKGSTIWFTANMEYGRFQLENRGFPGTGEQLQVGSNPECARPQSEGAKSYLNDHNQAENAGDLGATTSPGDADVNTGDANATNLQQPPFELERRAYTGVQNVPPSIDRKYMAASRRENRPVFKEPVDGGGERMATGYAKEWMSNERGRFYNNIREVAPLAGYDTSPKPYVAASSPCEPEVLKVE